MNATEGEPNTTQSAAQPEGARPPAGAGEATVEQEAQAQALQPGDSELAAFVRSLDGGQVEAVPLMILVGGTLFSGELVGGAEWWDQMAQRARHTGGAVNTQFAEGADTVSLMYRDTLRLGPRPVGYLHMQNTVTGERQLGSWRFRLDQVQGWSWLGSRR